MDSVHNKNENDLTVSLRDVRFSYSGQSILRDLCLDVRRGDFFVIVGESGSGKTTLLKLVARLLKPQSGIVDVLGSVRLVFQEDRLFPWYRAITNITAALTAGRTSEPLAAGRAARERAEQLFAEMGMSGLEGRYPAQLSGGERQRVAIARAFATEPEIVLMDEPFGSLDVLTRERMHDWLLQFWRKHSATVIFVTHDIEEGLILGDRIGVLANGKLGYTESIDIERPRDFDLRYSVPVTALRRKLREHLIDPEDGRQ